MSVQSDRLELAKQIALESGATRLIVFGSGVESPETARDLDLACAGVDGWKLYELGARLEQALRVPLDLVPLEPPSKFTRMIERQGRALL